MDHMIPILELMAEHTESVADEHKHHKLDIKAIVEHFKKYNETNEIARQKCEQFSEDCCKEVVGLEKKFHDEMDLINHDKQDQ